MAQNRKISSEGAGRYQPFSGLLDDHLNALLNVHKQFADALNHETVPEEEKVELLSIASVRDKSQLANEIRKYLSNMFGVRDYYISVKNPDETTSYFLHDLYLDSQSELQFKEIMEARIPIAGSLAEIVFNSDEQVVFDIDELKLENKISSSCISFWLGTSIKQILAIRLKVGKEDIGIFWTKPGPFGNHFFKGISGQIAVSMVNIIANEEIVRREQEKELLLSLNIDIATVRNNQDLLSLIKLKLKTLLGCSHTFITTINPDELTATAFLLDPDGKAKNHIRYKEVIAAKHSLEDGVLNVSMSSSVPVVFNLAEVLRESGSPAFFQMNYDNGIRQAVVTRLSKSDGVFGFWILFFDQEFIPERLTLIKSLGDQIAIAVSNIKANEEIQRRENEKSRLLDFSNVIVSVRDRNVLAGILKRQLADLFTIEDYIIHALGDDKKTHYPILSFPKSDFVLPHEPEPVLELNDSYFNEILESRDTVCHDVSDWFHSSNPPSYIVAAKAVFVKKIFSISLRIGQDIIAVMHFKLAGINDVAEPKLFQSVCSQLALTVANIIANERVNNQIAEIDRYKELLEEEKIYLKEEIEINHNYSEIIGESLAMKKTFRLVTQVAPSDTTVLILGETGTGKELIARAIHNNSSRKNRLMVKVNCAALPPNLIESELFGHERGSFTGATERRLGKFELANNGTLFLDEIGEMPVELQVKLLRALQEKEIERVGGKGTIKVDVRIIAATNRDLEKEMEAGRFRSDLYYRLNIFPISLPPLRDRKEDISLLATYFIYRYAKKIGREITTLSNKVLDDLLQYSWPGNIRELEHSIERSILISSGTTLKEIDLPSLKKSISRLPADDESKVQTIAENERDHILKILKYCKGRVAGEGGAADLLGVPTSTLNSKMKKLGIKKEHLA